jgi:predicted O-linked N-acetylglucosamine transferase (SPINDLY family)
MRAEVKRNDPCPCGSGKKYKKCCLEKAVPAAAPAAAAEVEALWEAALAQHRAGRLGEAERLYREVLARRPAHPQALHRLGMLAYRAGRYEAARDWMSRALEVEGGDAGRYNDLGLVYQALGRFEEAVECYRQAITRKPGYVAYHNLGLALASLSRYHEALVYYRKALAVKPDLAESLNNSGYALNSLGRSAEAIPLLHKALAINPAYAEAHVNLGIAHFNARRLDEAARCYKAALAFRPDYPKAMNNLANVHITRHADLDEAVQLCSRALAVKQDFALACHSLGVACLLLGQVEESMACLTQAIALQPDFVLAWDSRLLATNYLPQMSPAARLAMHREYAARFEAPLKADWQPHANGPDPDRRLKVGYVSADFCLHAVAFFIEPVLASHDRQSVESYCYYTGTVRDALTERLQAAAGQWRDCVGMNDAELAARIRADGIDVLVDLAGHTRGNRLLAFARKPAPVQVTYLGYVATTGLEAMDYRLSHRHADPESCEGHDSERLYRLPHSLWCYRPPSDMPEVSTETPARRCGYVTFGSMNNIAKVSDAAIALWSRLLHELPDARLILAGVAPGGAQARLYARFTAHDVDPARIELQPMLPTRLFRELHHRIDVALDAFPHNGNTTTCESLWMGVPVLSLTGDHFAARFGCLLLNTVGLGELAVPDEEAFIIRARAMAGDLDRLDQLRAAMRARLTGSPLRDEAGFTRDLEAAYRDMWRQWCATSGTATRQSP